MASFDLVVLGGGTAGLTAAIGAASQGARTMLVERDRTGGDCLWTGCVPSKALLAVAERAQAARTGGRLGVQASGVTVDFTAAMAHVKQAIATIAPHDSPERLEREGSASCTEPVVSSDPIGSRSPAASSASVTP